MSVAAAAAADQQETGTGPMIRLMSSDKKTFSVDLEAIQRSKTISGLVEALGVENVESADPIPVDVQSDVLDKVLVWCRKHRGETLVEIQENQEWHPANFRVPDWDKEFYKMDQSMVCSILTAANYLEIKPLLDYGCKTIADQICGLTVEQLRERFNIVNDFTPEEEETIRKENAWCKD